MMVVRYKTVSASSAQALDVALEAARHEITQRNENADFIGLELAVSQSTIYATIVWVG